MILAAFRRAHHDRNIYALYGVIVAQARLPAFYAASCGVPDTVEGRFELIVLHLVLVLSRLNRQSGREKDAAPAIGQRLFDVFCRDLDHNLREMGTGDLAVPREMRRLGEAFYGRQAAYSAALGAADHAALETALARNIYGLSGVDDRAAQLARYTRAAVEHLDTVDADALIAGNAVFPRPEDFARA
jgi:cytochrome b pre-mRNA-processing protein 3